MVFFGLLWVFPASKIQPMFYTHLFTNNRHYKITPTGSVAL